MKIRVFALIKEKKKILLIRESNPKYHKRWHLPGGTLHEGETIKDAVIREAKEESGYRIALNGIFYIKYITRPVTERGLYVYCTARTLTGSIKTKADEHSIEAGWFDMKEIEKLELRGDLIEILYKGEQPLISTEQFQL